MGGGEGGTGQNDDDDVLAAGRIQNVDPQGNAQVNGISFNTQSSNISKDGQPASATQLETGMVVLVTGKKNSTRSAVASQLQVVDTLQGPLNSSPSRNSFDIMGQIVLYDQNTVLKNISSSEFSDLSSGDLLEVSGFIKESGIIVATYIEQKQDLSSYEIKGFISNLNSETKQFDIGGLRIDYNTATPINFVNDLIQENMFVQVIGSAGNFDSDDDHNFKVDVVKHQILEVNDNTVNDIDNIEIEGFVAIDLNNNEFYLNNLKVQINASTQFERGTSLDIVKGTKIEVEGYLASGVIVAEEISFQEGIELRGNISVISENGNITLDHINTSITISTDNKTQLGDITRVGDLNVGNHIRVIGRTINDGKLLATHVSLIQTAPSSRLRIQSHFSSYDSNSMQINLSGFKIQTSDISARALETTLDNFLANLKFDELVRCDGTVDLATGVISWTSIEKGD